jgi:hypothetical protein
MRQSKQHLAEVEADPGGNQLCDQNERHPGHKPINISAAEAPTSDTGVP